MLLHTLQGSGWPSPQRAVWSQMSAVQSLCNSARHWWYSMRAKCQIPEHREVRWLGTYDYFECLAWASRVSRYPPPHSPPLRSGWFMVSLWPSEPRGEVGLITQVKQEVYVCPHLLSLNKYVTQRCCLPHGAGKMMEWTRLPQGIHGVSPGTNPPTEFYLYGILWSRDYVMPCVDQLS